MAYIGKEPASGIRNRFIFTATAGQTTFSGTDDHNRTLSYTDAEFTDVFLNGIKLDKSDYTATSGTSIVLDEAAAVDDIVEVIAFDTFSVFSGEFSQDVTVGGNVSVPSLTLEDGASDWSFEVVSNNLVIKYGGTGKAKLDTSGNLTVIGNVTAFGTI